MITRERIIIIGAIISVIAVFTAAYFLYFQEKMDAFAANTRFMNELDRTYADLSSSFNNYEPRGLIELWTQQVQPWADNRNELSTFYNIAGWRGVEQPPAGVAIVKFWYEEEAKRMEEEFYRHIFEKMGDYRGRVPEDIRATLKVAKLDDWQGVDVNNQQVIAQLANLAYGMNLVKFIVDNNAYAIKQLHVWPFRREQNSQNLLEFQTVGLELTMTLEDFVKFMDNLRTSTRYFSVDALSMSYPYISYRGEPYIDFKILFTHSRYIGPREAGPAGGGDAAAVFQNTAMTSRQGAAQLREEPGFGAKAWKWFKNNVLYIN